MTTRSPRSGGEAVPRERDANLAARAYRWLARRDRSRSEMQAYLERYCEDHAAVVRMLDELEQRGYLSETRLADQVIRAQRARSSAARIRQQLARRGVGAEVIAATTETLDRGDLQAALALWHKRFRELPSDRATRERQIRYLLNRGFSHAIALKVLREAGVLSRSEPED